MSTPSNRIGGVRGPNGATLDDVVTAVSNLLPVMESIQSSVAALAQRVDALFLPDPAIIVDGLEWEGLQRMLLTQLQTANDIFDVNDRHASFTLDLRGWLGYHLGALPQEGAVQPGGQAAPAKLYLSAIDTAAALTSASGDTAYSRFGTLRDNSTALLQAIGTLPSSPGGVTLKQLLAAIEACSCAGVVDPPPVVDPPAGYCDGFGLVRMLSWEPLAQGVTVAGVNCDIYRAQWDFSGGALEPAQGYRPSGEPNAPQSIRMLPDERANFCLSWQYSSAAAAPVAFGRDIGTGSPIVNSQFVGTQQDAAGITVGGFTEQISRCGGLAERLIAYNFAFPAGITPGTTVWLGVTDVPCAS